MKRIFMTVVMVSSLIVASSVPNANASDGAGVWAVVDSSGTVTNVIVCTQAVCGSGTFGGQRVVPQIAPNPITNDATGQGSFIGNESAGIRVTESNGVFTVHENMRINSAETLVTVDSKTKTTTTVISEVSVPVASRSFTYKDTIGKTYSEIKLKNNYDENSPTNVSVTKKTSFENELEQLKSENLTLTKRLTEQELNDAAKAEYKSLIVENINSVVSLLNDWLKDLLPKIK